MDSDSKRDLNQLIQPVSKGELNSWRRGFTPQAEIWNGRMAMFGLAFGLGLLILMRSSLGN